MSRTRGSASAPSLGRGATNLRTPDTSAEPAKLRRLRLHGFIERIPQAHRYRVTDGGPRAELFLTRVYVHLL